MKIIVWLVFFLGLFNQIDRIFCFPVIIVSGTFIAEQIVQKFKGL